MTLKKFLNLHRDTKSFLLILLDIFILLFSIQFSFNIRFEEFYQISQNQIFYCLFFVLVFLFFQFREEIYLIPSRNFDASIIPRILKNIFLCSILFFLVNFFFFSYFNIPRSIPVIFFFLASTFLIFKHSLLLNFFYFFKKNRKSIKNNLIIYGQINNMFSLVNEIKKNSNFNFLGFIDTRLPNYKNYEKFYLLKDINHLLDHLKNYRATHLLVSRKLNYKEKIKILRILHPLNLRVIFLHSNYGINFLDSKIKFSPEYNDILEKKFDDHLSKIHLKTKFTNKVFLVTGAGGSIGSELSYKLLNFNFKKIILIDVSEISLHNLKQKIEYHSKFNSKKVEFKLLNLIDYNILENIFSNNKIDFIFHAAAYKHVNIVETNAQFGLKNNILITKNICQLALKYKVKTNVLISTDKAVNPKNIMGLSKRICENIFKFHSKNTSKLKFIVTRFGNVIGSSGSVLPIFKNCIQNNLPLGVTSKKATRYIMTIEEACSLVIKSSIIGENGNFYVFDMGKPLNVYNLAKLFINMHGLRYKIFLKKNYKNNLNDFISICLIGLKKGEKLHEELSYKKDLLPTQFKKILISKEMFLELEKNFETKLHDIRKILDSKNQNDTIKFLKKLI